MPRVLRYREAIRRLLRHDDKFEVWVNRAKGSERMIYHPDVNGRAASYPVKCHGHGTELGKGTLKAIIRRFNLPTRFFD